jgi:sugar/nucleoside kinase (ribokinase family)
MIVVAGHLCLDIIPALSSETEMRPGILVEAGKAQLSTGGAVSNVGISLHKLGADVRLIGKVGDDAFGRIVLDILSSDGLAEGVVVDSIGDTSYTVVVSPPGHDRTFIHCPGTNDTFTAADVPDSALVGASHLHFGYPPLMAAMSTDGGAELVSLFSRARSLGLTTSLDMSLPDPASKQGQVGWEALLVNVLPLVDLFMPSEDELAYMLPSIGTEVPVLAAHCLTLGAKEVVLKCGSLGVYGIGQDRVGHWQPCFPAEVVGTTGSGDATIAGFLYGRSIGLSFAKCLEAGCAVGACCVQVADAVSGIMDFETVIDKFAL